MGSKVSLSTEMARDLALYEGKDEININNIAMATSNFVQTNSVLQQDGFAKETDRCLQTKMGGSLFERTENIISVLERMADENLEWILRMEKLYQEEKEEKLIGYNN